MLIELRCLLLLLPHFPLCVSQYRRLIAIYQQLLHHKINQSTVITTEKKPARTETPHLCVISVVKPSYIWV